MQLREKNAVVKFLDVIHALGPGSSVWHECIREAWLGGHVDVVELLLTRHDWMIDPCALQ